MTEYEEIAFKFECSDCGLTDILVDDEAQDSSPVSCAKCGQHLNATWADVKEAALKSQVGEMFKGSGWEVS